MATTALAMLQDVRECRWGREVERAWVCLREGSPRKIATEECRTCAQWERPAVLMAASAAHAGVMGETTAALVVSGSVRAILVLMAVFFATLGFVTLSEPLSVPFTVMLWLCAAAFVALAVFWNPPAE
jgi:hypothetical protein